ncbi:MAG TPA: hypothetical protein VF902_05420, partial [Coriobacteriia bacterium]
AGGKVYVADALRGEVVVFGVDGKYQTAFGKGVLVTPLYVAENPLDGRVYVTDRKAVGVHVFDRGGTQLRLFEPTATDDGPDLGSGWRPLAIAFGSGGTMYVTDTSEPQRALKISPTGALLVEAGRSTPIATAGPELAFANGIAPSGEDVLVVDSNNGRLLFLDAEFRRVGQATFDGLPRGAAVIPTAVGRVYAVVDAAGSDVHLVDARGTTLETFSGRDTTAGPMYQPTAVADDGASMLYVTDTGNRRVLQFSLGPAPAAAPLGLPRVGRDAQSSAAWAVAIIGCLITLAFVVRAVRSLPPRATS